MLRRWVERDALVSVGYAMAAIQHVGLRADGDRNMHDLPTVPLTSAHGAAQFPERLKEEG